MAEASSNKADSSAPGGAETVAVFTALVRCGGTLASTLLLLRSGGALHQPSSHTVFRVGRRVIFIVTTSLATLIIGTIGVLVIVKDAGDNYLLRSKVSILQDVFQVTT